MTKRKRHSWEHSSNSPLKGVIWQCSFKLLTGWDRQTERQEDRKKERETEKHTEARHGDGYPSSTPNHRAASTPHTWRLIFASNSRANYPGMRLYTCTQDGLAFHLNFGSFSRVHEIQVRLCNCGSAALLLHAGNCLICGGSVPEWVNSPPCSCCVARSRSLLLLSVWPEQLNSEGETAGNVLQDLWVKLYSTTSCSHRLSDPSTASLVDTGAVVGTKTLI